MVEKHTKDYDEKLSELIAQWEKENPEAVAEAKVWARSVIFDWFKEDSTHPKETP